MVDAIPYKNMGYYILQSTRMKNDIHVLVALQKLAKGCLVLNYQNQKLAHKLFDELF